MPKHDLTPAPLAPTYGELWGERRRAYGYVTATCPVCGRQRDLRGHMMADGSATFLNGPLTRNFRAACDGQRIVTTRTSEKEN